MGDFWNHLLSKAKGKPADLENDDVKLNRSQIRQADKITAAVIENQPSPGVDYRTLNYWCETALTLMKLGSGDTTGKVKRKIFLQVTDALRFDVAGFLTGKQALPGGNGRIPEDIFKFYWGSAKFKELWTSIDQTEQALHDFIDNRARQLKIIG